MTQKAEYLPPNEHMSGIHLFSSPVRTLDSGGTFVSDLKDRIDLDVDISEKIKPHQWEKLPWRWVVEHTFSWINHSSRLSKDYEISVSPDESMAMISHFHALFKRL